MARAAPGTASFPKPGAPASTTHSFPSGPMRIALTWTKALVTASPCFHEFHATSG